MGRILLDVSPLRRHRHFAQLFAGQAVSSIGSQLTVVAVSFQAYSLTHSTLMVGLIGLVTLVPLLAGSLWGGALADSMDRRRVLLMAQIAMAASSGGLVLNASFHHPALWPLFVATGVASAFQGVDWPARRAALPALVSNEDVTAAVALQTTIGQLALVAGPAIGGILIAAFGLATVYAIDVATYACSLTAVVLLPALAPSVDGPRASLKSMAEGFRYLKGQKVLSASYWIDFNAMVFGMPRAVFPALGTGLFHGGAGVVGLLYAAPGAGALVGSFFTGWCVRLRNQGRAICACVLVWGGTIALFGVIPVLWIGLALLATAGAADMISGIFRQGLQQRKVPDHLQGRLSGTFFAFAVGGNKVGDGEAGLAAQIGGPQFAVWSGGLACLVSAAFLLWRVPELWNDDGEGMALSPKARIDAIIESTNELSEGEPM